MAAGLSLPKENVEKFRTFLNEHTTLTEEDFIPKITIDVPMPIGYVTEHLIEELSVLAGAKSAWHRHGCPVFW